MLDHITLTESNDAKDNTSPRARAEYYPVHYAAGLFDFNGYLFEAIHKSRLTSAKYLR